MHITMFVALGMCCAREHAVLSNHIRLFKLTDINSAFFHLTIHLSAVIWQLQSLYIRGRRLWRKKTTLSLDLFSATRTGEEKWRGLLLRNWLTLKRNASRLALFVVTTECDRTSKATNITVLSWTVTVKGASRDVEKETSWNSKFVLGGNRWRTLETMRTAVQQP